MPKNFLSKGAEDMLSGADKNGPDAADSDNKKQSFLVYQQEWIPERMGDYVGPKIPSLLEFLENKINQRDSLGLS